MVRIVPISSHPSRCAECRQAIDCPLHEEHGAASHSVCHTRVRVVHHGECLFRAGDPVDAVYRVRSGMVKSTLTGGDGGEQVTGFFGPGDWLGLDALDGAAQRSDAVALDTASVCVIPFTALRERLARSPRAARILLDAASRRLARKEDLHLTLAKDNAARRLAGFLLDLSAQRAGAGLDAGHVALAMSRGDIASYLALAVETVSRLLTRMHRAGVVEVHRHHVQVIDAAALARTAGREPPAARASSARRSA